MNGCVLPPQFDATLAKETLNRWIVHETARATREVTEAIEACRFNDAAGSIYRFVWNVYCDWYLELAKPVLLGEEGDAKTETRAMVAWARDEILKLLHPFMPFITEELWAVTAMSDGASLSPSPLAGEGGVGGKPQAPAPVIPPSPTLPHKGGESRPLLALAQWPNHAGLTDNAAEAEIGWVVDLVTAIRSVRAEMNISPATLMPLIMIRCRDKARTHLKRWDNVIKRLARLGDISFENLPPPGAIQLLVRDEVAALPLKGVIDLSTEKARLNKENSKA